MGLFLVRKRYDRMVISFVSARVVDFKISGKDTSESFNAKRKVESDYGLFCVMRKRSRRQKSVDDIFPDLEDAEKFILDEEGMIVDDCCNSGSDTELSESSEFDVISDMDLMGESTLSMCNFPWRNEDEGALVTKLSSETQNSIFLLSPHEVNEETGVRSKDEDKSSAIEVRYGDVVNNDELRPWNKGDDPIPISIVLPDADSSILLETCSLHQIVSFRNEYNVHGDHIGLEITPIPLTKTLEGPSRSWSVCGSLAAARNLPLMEDNSGACSYVDEQLCVNVSSSECRDAELAQTPSTLYQEEVDGEDEICFSDIDAMIRRLNLIPDDSDSWLNREAAFIEWNMSKHPRHTLLGLEHCTRTSMRRAIMSQWAIAVLHCRDSKHFVRKHEVIIGRSSDGLNVDIDLGKDGYGSKISRRQALVKLGNNGSFSLKNLGKRQILVNGEKLDTGQTVTLTSCSSIDIRGMIFVFKINKEAVRQFLTKNTRRDDEDDTKFRWCE